MEISTARGQLLTLTSELEAAQKAQAKVEQDIQELPAGADSALLQQQLGALTQQESDLLAKQQDAQTRLEPLGDDLKGLEKDAANTLKVKIEAEDKEAQARTALHNTQDELRQFATETVWETRKTLEVHRRVIDALKEIETVKSPALTSAPSLPTVRPPGILPPIRSETLRGP